MTALTERENALRVITRSGDPEWIPLTGDCFRLLAPSCVRERPVAGENGDDWFGCSWVWDAECFGFAPEIRKPLLLSDISEWRGKVKFPDLDSIDWQSAADRDLEGFDRKAQLLRIMMESGPFERSHHLLGFENAFIAMMEEPEDFRALIDAIADYKVKLIEKVAKYYKPDEIMFQDDLGTAKGPMISVAMYRELLKPAHRKIAEAIQKNGIMYTHHSCGHMEAFIDDLLELGVQMINPVQPMNNQAALAEKYAGKLTFEVGGESLANYEDASEEAIRSDIRRIIDTFGPHMNLVMICYPTNVRTLGSIDIAIDEIRRYGRQFYKK
jgi:hypothetical protein